MEAKPITGLGKGEQYSRTPAFPCTPVPLPLGWLYLSARGHQMGWYFGEPCLLIQACPRGRVPKQVCILFCVKCGPLRCVGLPFTKMV